MPCQLRLTFEDKMRFYLILIKGQPQKENTSNFSKDLLSSPFDTTFSF